MAGECSSRPDDEAGARADDERAEQVRADAVADRVADHSVYVLSADSTRIDTRPGTPSAGLNYDAAVEAVAVSLARTAEERGFPPGEDYAGQAEAILRPALVGALEARLVTVEEARGWVERLPRFVAVAQEVGGRRPVPGAPDVVLVQCVALDDVLEALAPRPFDPSCSLCQAGHVPPAPCGDEVAKLDRANERIAELEAIVGPYPDALAAMLKEMGDIAYGGASWTSHATLLKTVLGKARADAFDGWVP